MRRIITLIIIILSVFYGYSQTKELDSLSIELAYQGQDTLKIETSLKFIKALYTIEDYEKASSLKVKIQQLENELSLSN